MVLIQSLAGLFLALIAIALIKLYKTYHRGQSDYKGIPGRLRILWYEDNHICFFAGEAWWQYYDLFLSYLDTYPRLRIDIIIGRTISHYPEAITHGLVDQEGRLTLKCLEDLAKVHPLFKYALNHDYSNRITIYVKNTNNTEEVHFALGRISQVSFVESPKDIEPPSGGTIFTDEKTFAKYQDRFLKMINDEKVCRPLFNPENRNDMNWIRKIVDEDWIRFSNTKSFPPQEQPSRRAA